MYYIFYIHIHPVDYFENISIYIPFFQKVRLYTEMMSGEIDAYKPERIIVYSYVINQSRIREFHARAHSDHYYVKFRLSSGINKLIDSKSSNDDVINVATDVFREFTLIDSKNKSIEPFFKEFTIDVKARY